MKKFKVSGGAGLLIFLAWLVYTTSYFGKVNYSANITQIIDFYGITKAQAGAVPTFFFFAYGVGQVVNGLLCKKYNVRWMVFASLMVSAAINLVIGFSTDFGIIKWLWLVNGFALSILWPSLIRTLSESLPQKSLATSSVIMGTTVALGTLVIYGLSSVFAAFDVFKFSFYTAAVAVIAVAFVWLLVYGKAVKKAVAQRDSEADEVRPDKDTKESQQSIGSHRVFLASVCILCFYAVGVNLIKDGLTTWVPAILKDRFDFSDSLSILLTLFLPIVAVFGNLCAVKVHRIIPDYVTHCAVVFALISALIGGIIGSMHLQAVVLMLVGLVVVSFMASSLNSLLTGVFPLFMRGKVNSGLFAGIINGFCYLGSTISAYGLGLIADNAGWESVFLVLVAFCFAALAVWNVYGIIRAAGKKRGL